MMKTTIPSTIATEFNIDELTTGTVDGTGAYDVLLKTYKAHLWEEYKQQRIRGTDYANAYIQLLSQGLGHISNYALQKAKLPLELQLLEAQIQKLGADTILTTKQGGLVDAQIYSTMKDVELKDYELKHIKPIELQLRREELKLKQQEIQLREKDIALKEKQLAMMDKELAFKEKELQLKEKQLEATQYELEHKLPAEVASVTAQAELYKQKVVTEKAQTDNTVVGAGSVIDRNNQVLAEQARGFDLDAKMKLSQLLVSTWNVRRNDDPDTAPADQKNKLDDITIGKAVQSYIDAVERV